MQAIDRARRARVGCAAALSCLVLLFGGACGASEEPERPAAERSATTPLPGKAIRADPYYELGEDVRELLAVAFPYGRLRLLVGRRGDGRLCAFVDIGVYGNGAYCDVDERPLYVLGFGGASPRAVDWTGLVGLVDSTVDRAEVRIGSVVEPVHTHVWSGFDRHGLSWRGRIRDGEKATLVTYARDGSQLASYDVGRLVWNTCEHDPRPSCGTDEGEPGPWTDLGDPRAPTPVDDLSAEQREALEILLGDDRVRSVIGGPAWHVSEYQDVGVYWSTCEGDEGGTSVVLDLERPLDVERLRWPVMLDECDGRAYRVEERCHSVENILSLTIDVDVERRRVVAIRPEGDALRVDGHREGKYGEFDLPGVKGGVDQLPPGC